MVVLTVKFSGGAKFDLDVIGGTIVRIVFSSIRPSSRTREVLADANSPFL